MADILDHRPLAGVDEVSRELAAIHRYVIAGVLWALSFGLKIERPLFEPKRQGLGIFVHELVHADSISDIRPATADRAPLQVRPDTGMLPRGAGSAESALWDPSYQACARTLLRTFSRDGAQARRQCRLRITAAFHDNRKLAPRSQYGCCEGTDLIQSAEHRIGQRFANHCENGLCSIW